MSYLIIDEHGTKRQIDELDNDVLEMFDEASCDIIRCKDGVFEVPRIQESHTGGFEIVEWVRVDP